MALCNSHVVEERACRSGTWSERAQRLACGRSGRGRDRWPHDCSGRKSRLGRCSSRFSSAPRAVAVRSAPGLSNPPRSDTRAAPLR